MSTATHTPPQAPSGGNGQATPHDLFALTDEQILAIEPEVAGTSQANVRATPGPPNAATITNESLGGAGAAPTEGTASQSSTEHESRGTEHSPEPPAWLAAQMKDPWSGEAARELWNGVAQARQEAASYRAAFATPEDAKALKELYPGGINEARATSVRARVLEDIDRAYFGLSGGTPEQASAGRAELAQRMLREDPAAFREMVFAGLRALEDAEKGSGSNGNASSLPRLAQVFATNRRENQSAVAATLASPAANTTANGSPGGTIPAPTPPSVVGAQHAAPQLGNSSANEAHLAAYAAFEKAANEELERSVGAAITRTIEQALPNLHSGREEAIAGARHGVPLRDRLAASVRQDVESSLKGDRQLGEQIAQILSTCRFDNETRAQVVRLIDDRARQLVPVAAKRVINDWTQTTLAAHRSGAARSDAASARREVEPAVAPGLPAGQAGASPATVSSRAAQTRPAAQPHRNASRSDARSVDYRKLSDEQILDF